MTVDGLVPYLPQMRRDAESRMSDTYRFSVPTGGYVYDPEAQADVEEFEPLFEAPGYIPPASAVNLSQDSEAGGRTVVEARREIRIPWDSEAIPPNAVAECIAVGPLTPPRMLGKRYRVGGTDGASQGTACHVEIVEELA